MASDVRKEFHKGTTPLKVDMLGMRMSFALSAGDSTSMRILLNIERFALA